MKLGIIALTLSLLATQTLACATVGDSCDSTLDTECVCNEGYIAVCEEVVVGDYTEYYWAKGENCPVPSDGGLQCVDGACTS
ncbi:hypothetical protein ASPZODRAFT_137366 [Penicilliopsis zonata CBS 506.65]|uniref:Extracellular membrane protein CFEM domain-containing protein n=1 Tax=Penicilliopsis zonata CBS 506.65 TaxID=1073090 RepID=A0A1L9S545_9EURO|nr:hypothetical protein ASPZODRAFT_137366 [Penicilliopsis zonata CBS 506.65]OJJ42273.1 hypothetical protein ASPZODRAFT_137366 [Penicilliopsis zonata CBS 506.65]